MGGFGSGNWYPRYDRKTTVEESLSLAMRNFRGLISPHSLGTFTWPSDNTFSVGFRVTCGDKTIITLYYRWRNSEDVRIPIRLQTTPTNFNGRRWWFTCPLIVGGVPCNRRAGKVYLPPGARYFGCRKCHDLTYRSSREAHLLERLLSDDRMDKMRRRLDALNSKHGW